MLEISQNTIYKLWVKIQYGDSQANECEQSQKIDKNKLSENTTTKKKSKQSM